MNVVFVHNQILYISPNFIGEVPSYFHMQLFYIDERSV